MVSTIKTFHVTFVIDDDNSIDALYGSDLPTCQNMYQGAFRHDEGVWSCSWLRLVSRRCYGATSDFEPSVRVFRTHFDHVIGKDFDAMVRIGGHVAKMVCLIDYLESLVTCDEGVGI